MDLSGLRPGNMVTSGLHGAEPTGMGAWVRGKLLKRPRSLYFVQTPGPQTLPFNHENQKPVQRALLFQSGEQ